MSFLANVLDSIRIVCMKYSQITYLDFDIVKCCKTLFYLDKLQVDGSGKLGFTEFLYLWKLLQSWKVGTHKCCLIFYEVRSCEFNKWVNLWTALAETVLPVWRGRLRYAQLIWTQTSIGSSRDQGGQLYHEIVSLALRRWTVQSKSR